jgi:multiple sugar transport system permease protein
MKTLAQQKKRTGLFFITPTVLVLMLVVLIPLIFSFIVSFFNYTLVDPSFERFIFFKNYSTIFQDTYLWNSLKITLIFVFTVVPLEFVLGFFIALLLNRDIRFKGLFYTILTIPMVMSPVAVGLIWKMFLHADLGIVNYIFSVFNLPSVNWLGSNKIALFTIILIDIWHQISFMILILLAGLKSLPKEPFESAKIDGASNTQSFFYITLGLMKPVISVAILIRVIFSFKTYDLVYIMTRGGPGVSTELISYFIYKKTFMGMDFSQATAISYVLLAIIMVIIIFLFREMSGRRWD